jgi:iron complex outermembrane receptor protein
LNAGIFAEHRFALLGQRLFVTPGIYVNWLSDHGWEAYPGIEAGYRAFGQYLFYATAGRSFRLPTYTDLYYSDPANQGNPSLAPESAWQFEWGVRRSGTSWRAEANVFYRNGRNLIDWIRADENALWQPVNFRSKNTLGGELSAALVFPELLGRDSFFLQRFDLSLTWMDVRPDTSVAASRYALSHLRKQLVAGFRHRIVGRLTNDVRLRWVERSGQAPYCLLDCRLAWTFRNGAGLYLEGTNLLNTEYREIGTVPMPGFWLRLGGTFHLGLGR